MLPLEVLRIRITPIANAKSKKMFSLGVLGKINLSECSHSYRRAGENILHPVRKQKDRTLSH